MSAKKIEGQFVWTEGEGGIFTPEAFEEFRNRFSRIFLYAGILELSLGVKYTYGSTLNGISS